jgi:hypothetical protein
LAIKARGRAEHKVEAERRGYTEKIGVKQLRGKRRK